MPVWISRDKSLDIDPKSSKQRRHIDPNCKVYLDQVPAPHRSPSKGAPNTEPLQERTVRCEGCWPVWVKSQGEKKTASPRATKKGAATAPVTAVGGKSASLADRAKAARRAAPPAVKA